jgi:hypothetical protein
MATVQDVLNSLSASNDGITAARDFIKANPAGGATQAQLDQIFGAAQVVRANVQFLQNDLGMPPATASSAPAPKGDIFGG